MLVYLLKMIACSAAFYALYALLFRKEKMLVFNRFYLLGGLAASFIIPLITITVEIPAAQAIVQTAPVYPINTQAMQKTDHPDTLPVITVICFTMISLGLLTRFCINLARISKVIREGKRISLNNSRIVLLDTKVAPYSFLNTIFLNREEFENGEVEKEVLAHELAHVHQKHTWDIIFIELLQVFCWFNPVIYLYRRSVKINHELLADAAVIKQAGDVRSYQQVLLQRAIAQSSLALVSSFTFYTTKKRLRMLQKKYNKARAAAIGLLTLPVLAVAIAMGCNTETKRQETSVEQDDIVQSPAVQNNTDTFASVRINDVDTSAQDMPMPPPPPKIAVPLPPPPPKEEMKKFAPPKIIRDFPEGPGATSSELAEYELIVKKIRTVENKRKMDEHDFENILSIYKKMTIGQRVKAAQLPMPLPPPPEREIKQFTPPKIVKDEEPVSFSPPVIINETKPALSDYKEVDKIAQLDF